MEELLYERIKKYKNRQLTEAERLAFEDQLETDPTFAEEVAAWTAIYTGIQEKGDKELDEQLFAFGKKLLQEESGAPETSVPTGRVPRRFALPRWVYAAAALLLLLVFAWPVYQRLNRPDASAESLFAAHFNQPPAPAVRDAPASPWRDPYERKQYPEAIAALEKLLADPAYPRRSEAGLFLGLARLGAGQTGQAVDAFQQVSPDSFEWDDAQWYLALAYLKLGDLVKAKALLQMIAAKPGNSRLQEVKNMLEQLK